MSFVCHARRSGKLQRARLLDVHAARSERGSNGWKKQTNSGAKNRWAIGTGRYAVPSCDDLYQPPKIGWHTAKKAESALR